MDHPIPARRPDFVLIKKKKILAIYLILLFHIENIQQSEELNQYLDLDRKLKSLRNMKVTAIPNVVMLLDQVKNQEKIGQI